MADNAAQAIKDLQKELVAMDKQLFLTNQNFELIGKTVVESMKKGEASINDLYKALASKLNARDLKKFKVTIEKEQMLADAEKLRNAIQRSFSQIKIGDNLIKGKETMKSLLADYESMLSKLPKDASSAFDFVLQSVNKAAGITGKTDKGTALGQARAKLLNEQIKATKEISKLQDEIAEKQAKLEKYKEGSRNWQKTKEEIENANKALQQYQDKLNRLQGRGVKDLGAKALRDQEKNFYKLNMLLNERRKLEAQIKAQGGTATDVQARYQKILNTSIQRTVDSMRALEKAYKGVTEKAGQNTIDARMRRTKASIDGVNSSLNKTNRDLNALIPTLTRLASAFGVAFSVRGLVQFGKKLIETRGQFELQQVAMRSILQNKQLADEIWDKTMKAALQSPFTAMQLTTYTKQLAAYRIETEKLFDTTKRLADVSAGLGVDMQRLILAYGQVKAANYLRASEIRQFTEAGVNILGELSTYLTEMKGEMISTAQVMEMVTKRMVTFADVEAIFKRMTDAGGIFYNMQYVQSQTVKGQIAKLHDAYDQMLNSIGKANEGVLKDMIAALNSIVQNWRTWAVVIKSIAWGSVIGYLSKFALALAGVEGASTKTLKSIVKLRQGIQKLGMALKANIPALIIGGVVSLGAALVNLNKKMKEVNDEIDEQNLRLYETRENFQNLKNQINENNSVLKDSASNTDSLNDAQKDNRIIMQKLENEYPQLAKQMKIYENGIIDINDAIDINIRKLNEQMIIMNNMKQGSWFSDSDQENLSDWEKALSRMHATLLAAQNASRKQMMQMEVEGRQGTTFYDIYKQVSEIDLSGNILDAVAAFKKLDEEVYGITRGSKRLTQYLGISASDLKANWSKGRVEDVLDRNFLELQYAYENGIKDNADYLKAIDEQYGGNITDFINANAKKINEDTKKGLVNANETLIKTLRPTTDAMRKYLNDELNKRFKTIGIDFFAEAASTEEYQTPPKKDQSEIDAAWRRRINLLEEMKRRFDELNKSAYGFERSRKLIVKAFDDIRDAQGNVIEKGAFSTIFEGTGITIGQVDVTSMEGMFKSMRLLLQQATDISESVKDELMKKIDSYEARITISAEVEKQNEFYKSLDKMFSDYDLTLDLEKLEFPTDELVGIFQFTPTTLEKIRKTVEDEIERRTLAGEDPKDFINKYNEYLNKIDDLEQKALVNRLKKYTQYLAKGRDEAVKIHLEEIRMIAELDKDRSHYTDAQYDDIVEQIKKETNQKLAKNRWQDFKESDFYVTMFQDLEHVSQVSIDIMLKKLNALRDEIKDLDPTQVKEITKAIEKLEKVTLKRNPVAQFFENVKKSKAWDREGNETLLGELIGTEADLQKEHDRVEKEVLKFQAEFDELSKNGTPQDAAYAKQNLDEAEAELSGINKDLEETKEKIDEINQKENEGYKALKERQQAMVNGVGYFNQMVDAAMTVNQEMMDMMDGVSDASKKLAKDIAEIATNAGLLVKDIAQAIMSEGTDVGAMIDGLIRTWNIIRGWLSAKERGINQDIEDQTNALKDLERELDAVQRAREKAWDTYQLVRYQNELNKTLEAQRDAYNAMIKAEKSRKNPDEDLIRQWEDAITEIDNMLEDEKEKFIQVFGGIGEGGYRDAASAFVDAWKEAFLETGNGLEGLQDHFDEFLNEWFVKQATMRIAGKMLEPLFADIDKAVDQYSAGGTNVLMSELNAIREKFGIIAPQLSDALEQLAGQWGLNGEGGLSGLAAGIQGMSEEQANILEAYWNSVRGYTASIDMNVSRIVELLGANNTGRDFNPQLQQLELIAKNTTAIQSMFSGVIKNGHAMGGQGIKVFVE